MSEQAVVSDKLVVQLDSAEGCLGWASLGGRRGVGRRPLREAHQAAALRRRK